MTQPSGAEIITQFLRHSPFALHLGMRLDSIEADRARLAMPYRSELATVGDVVHGGALSFDRRYGRDGGIVVGARRRR